MNAQNKNKYIKIIIVAQQYLAIGNRVHNMNSIELIIFYRLYRRGAIKYKYEEE